MSSSSPEINYPTLDDIQQHGDTQFPLVVQCESPEADLSETCEWIKGHAELLEQEARKHGAVLFRGFPVKTDQDFDQFITAFGLPNFPYLESLSNAVRVNRTERVFTANEAPPHVSIFFHHEMAQTPVYPSRLFFFCEKPAETGGATPICRSDVLWEQMREQVPKFAKNCQEKGLKYSNVMPGIDDPASGMGRSWQSTFRAGNREEAEARMSNLGYTWEWLKNDCLRATTPVLPAVREISPGRHSFFNQLIAAYKGWKDERNDPSKSITHGDGTTLDPEGVKTAIELSDKLAYDLKWQQGDVVLIDNYVAMHGRRTFEGTRKVLASLVAAD